MATWKAKCWLGSASGYQELEVQSNTLYGAEEQFKRIYGAEQVINLRRTNDNSFSIPSSGYGPALLALVVLFVIVEYWYIVVPIIALLTLGYLYQRFKK